MISLEQRFALWTKRVKGQELENWLVTNLHPQIHFRIYEAGESGNHFVLFEIPAAWHTPVRFKDTEYIRVGSYKKKLRDHPEIERTLWSILSRRSSSKEGISLPDATSDQVIDLLDYPNYFRLMKQPLPDNRPAILERMLKGSTDRGGRERPLSHYEYRGDAIRQEPVRFPRAGSQGAVRHHLPGGKSRRHA